MGRKPRANCLTHHAPTRRRSRRLRDAGIFFWLAITGGNSNDGSTDGVSTLNLNNALSNANWNIGARPSSTYNIITMQTMNRPVRDLTASVE